MRELGTSSEELESRFGRGKNTLSPKSDPENDTWYETDLSQLIKWEEEVKKSSKITLFDDEINCETSELVLWKRPRSSTSAGARDWHLIAFVPKDNEASCIKITIPFSLSLSKSHLKSYGAKYATTSGKKIILELPIENGSDIYRVTYEHDNQPSM